MKAASAYAEARRTRQAPQRLVVNLPKAEMARIDHWGVENGKSSRTEAVRDLINRGLQAAVGTGFLANPDFP